jgi:hypothetical protein
MQQPASDPVDATVETIALDHATRFAVNRCCANVAVWLALSELIPQEFGCRGASPLERHTPELTEMIREIVSSFYAFRSTNAITW